MLIENKSSSYPEIETRKRELCASYNQLPTIMKNIIIIIFFSSISIGFSQNEETSKKLYVLNINGAQIMAEPTINSMVIRDLKVGDEISVIEKLQTISSKTYKNENITLNDYWVKINHNELIGFIFLGDFTQIKPSLREIENNYTNENFYSASILGEKLKYEEKNRKVNYGKTEYIITDKITYYKNGKRIYYVFDGCYHSKYIFHQLSFNEVYQQMKNFNLTYGVGLEGFSIDHPTFKEKSDTKYIFSDLGMTDEVEIIINENNISLLTGGCN